jgi:hypothetical protein
MYGFELRRILADTVDFGLDLFHIKNAGVQRFPVDGADFAGTMHRLFST